jgi:2-keto-3-deoxy-L-rhamnonate aldolase RhmA
VTLDAQRTSFTETSFSSTTGPIMVEGNAVKHAAATGAKIRGANLTFAAPAIIEILAGAKLDFVYIDGEHGCFDWRDIEVACITAERHGLTAIARVPDPSVSTITKFLDRGVKGIAVPHISSVAEARAVVAAAYFAPLGLRSYGGSRPEHGLGITDKAAYMAAANRTISVNIMIENTACLNAAHEIAALDGVDFMSFGLNDLSQDMGFPGQPTHPTVKAAVEQASVRIRNAGKPVREDFMKFAWVRELITVGARELLG